MTTISANMATAKATRTSEQSDLVHWVFLQGTKAVSCELRSGGQHAFDVCVLPHWSVASGVVERFDSLPAALRRHAEISLAFRKTGWLLVREGRA